MDAIATPADRLACTRCIGDDRLRAEARLAGFATECAYCGRGGTCVDVAWLADRIHPALQSAFEPVPAGEASGALDGIAATASAAGLGAALARDVHHTLVTLFRDADGAPTYPLDGAYVERPARDLPALHRWHDYAAAAERAAPGTDGARLETLKWAFARVDSLATAKGRRALRVLEAGTRAFEACRDAGPGRPAPSTDADELPGEDPLVPGARTAEGPLNGAGVPHASLALRERTAVTQSLVPRGAQVVVARLRLARPLRVLDLEAARKALARTGALDPDRAGARARAAFLDGFADALRATHAGTGIATWRATQQVADWLAHGASPRVHALLTRAAHAPGRTLSLFAPACTTGALVVERERRYVVGALRAKYRRLSPSGPRTLRPRMPPARD